MTSPAYSPECIDIHTHIVPENFPAYVGKGKDIPWPSMAEAHACHRHVMISGKVYRTVADGSWSVPRRIEEMGAMRVTSQVISPMPELLSYWLPLEDAAVMVRYLNDQIADMVRQAPKQLIGLGAVPLQDTDCAIRELDYVMKDLKLAGVEVASHIDGISIGHERFEPFFAACEKAGAAIFVHALRPAGMERIVGAFAEQAVLFPMEIAAAAASMITGGIASKHPRLRIAFSHGGGGLSLLVPRLVHAWTRVQKTRESLPESPATIARRFYYDCLMFDPAAVRFVIESFGSSQICIGSDYPYAMADRDPLGTLEKTGIDAAMVAAIRSGNARRFLGL